jgi:hypothetical protein
VKLPLGICRFNILILSMVNLVGDLEYSPVAFGIFRLRVYGTVPDVKFSHWLNGKVKACVFIAQAYHTQHDGISIDNGIRGSNVCIQWGMHDRQKQKQMQRYNSKRFYSTITVFHMYIPAAFRHEFLGTLPTVEFSFLILGCGVKMFLMVIFPPPRVKFLVAYFACNWSW